MRFFTGLVAAGGIAMSLALPAQACRLALALTVDVSGSIDPGEYRFQMDGLATALEDPEVAEALVLAEAAITVIQWSGAEDQETSIPWQRMLSFDAVARLSQTVRDVRRRWSGGKTAVGDMLSNVLPAFDAVSDCSRRVVDVSGDGQSNDGIDTVHARQLATRMGVTINGLAIDRIGKSVTQFYRQKIRTGPNSFVITATGYSDYPRAIRRKLLRETVVPAF
ncbi:MAG: DUF1194 domain-containing protein [Pseudomonadota bacterium]